MANRVERLYDYLNDEEDARVCKDISDSACRVVPGNALLIFISQLLTKMGDALANPKVVLPSLFSALGVPAFFSGLLVPIRESGSMLPQLLIGGVVRRYPIRKGFFVVGSLLQGLTVFAMVWVALTFSGMQAGVLITLLLILFSLARGLCSVASKDVLGKTIPKTRRGTITGYCTSAAGLITLLVASGLLVLGPLQSSSAPGNAATSADMATDIAAHTGDVSVHSVLLAAGAVCWLLAALAYARIREYRGATDGGANGFIAALKRLSLLKSDAPLRHFVIVRALMMGSGLAAPYFVLLAQQTPDNHWLSSLAIFMIAGSLAGFISGVIWGKLADNNSRRVMHLTALATAAICATAAAVAYLSQHQPAILSPQLSFWLLVLLFFLLSVTHEGVRLGRKTYLVDMASGNRRTDYVAISNTLMGVLLLLIGLVGAAIAQLSLVAIVATFALLTAVAAWLSLRLPQT